MFRTFRVLRTCASRSQIRNHGERNCHGLNEPTTTCGSVTTLICKTCSLLYLVNAYRYKNVASAQECKDHTLSEKSYWTTKYETWQVKAVDWLAPADVIADHVISKVKTLPIGGCGSLVRLLDVGCGTSHVPLHLLKSLPCPLQIVCLDYVPGAAQWQSDVLTNTSPCNKLSTYTCIIGDVRALPFTDNTFHVILDKGTLDSLLKDRRPRAQHSCDRMISECLRTLRTGGALLQITDEDPDLRIQLLEEIFSRIKVSAHVSYSQVETQGYECFMYVLSL